MKGVKRIGSVPADGGEPRRPQPGWLRAHPVPGGLAIVALLALTLAGCSSSPQAARPSVSRTCQLVAAVLSDGPDPTADPVGYAEAQILPLRQITTSDHSLGSAIAELANAYQDVFTTNDGAAAHSAVDQASKKVDAICPGAAS